MPPLDSLRVLELSSGIAAAYCGKLLADAGAQVSVLEPPGGHALARQRPMEPPAQPGLLLEFFNEAKELISAEELASQGSRALDGVGLIIEDRPFAAGGPFCSDLGPAPGRSGTTLPDLSGVPLIVTISPFGTSGPWANRPASELVVQALSGSLIRRGLPGREPVQAGGSMVEWVSGTYAAAAAATQWWGRRSADAGQCRIDVSMLECSIVTLHPFTTVEAEFGRSLVPASMRGPSIPSVEPTSDGYVGFSTITGQQLQDFFRMIDRDDLADDPELLQVERRQDRRAELTEAIRAWTTCRPTEEIVACATARRIPVAPIGNGQNIPTFDHVVERKVLVPGPTGLLRPRVPFQVFEHEDAGDAPPPDGTGSLQGLTAAGPAGVSEPSHPAGTAPLGGLKVLDFTAFWAGPAGTHLLACLGADVVKVESIQRPDGMRFTTAKPGHEKWWEWGAVFHGVNSNKRSVTLDLADDRGRALVLRLARWADVVMENFSPRVLDQFGLGWEEISSCNPRAIMVRMPAFGLSGPWRDRTGFAMTVEQMSGLAWQTGYEDGPPMDVGGACDPLGGMHAVVALVAALGRRCRSGRGSLVEVPLMEVALNVAAEHVLQRSANGTVLRRLGNRSMQAAPQGVYACAGEDQWVAVSVASDEQWTALCTVLGLEDLSDDAVLASAEERWRARERIDDVLRRRCRHADGIDLEARLTEAGVPAASVVVPSSLMENPQLRARGFFEVLEHPVVGHYWVPSLPLVVDGRARRWHRSPPPTLGQHNAEVLRGLLGLDEGELRALEEAAVVGTRPAPT